MVVFSQMRSTVTASPRRCARPLVSPNTSAQRTHRMTGEPPPEPPAVHLNAPQSANWRSPSSRGAARSPTTSCPNPKMIQQVRRAFITGRGGGVVQTLLSGLRLNPLRVAAADDFGSDEEDNDFGEEEDEDGGSDYDDKRGKKSKKAKPEKPGKRGPKRKRAAGNRREAPGRVL